MHRLIASLVSALFLVSCGDDGTGPGNQTDTPPAAFALSAPEEIVQGQPFSLSVTALNAAGERDLSWSGPVSLSASSGSLSPSTVTLANGSTSVEVTLSGAAGAVTLSAQSGSVRVETAVTALSGEPAVRLEIVPGALLLTSSGETYPLRVRAFDAQGQPTEAEVTWNSSDPAVIAVGADGLAAAQVDLGSAQITATAGNVVSPPAPALVATPSAGAVLVPDSAIVEGPTPVDASAIYGPGWQYTVVLRGLSPAVGATLIGTGEVPLAGRVVAASAAGEGETEVTLELVPLNQLFDQLSFDLLIPLVEMPEEESNALARARVSRSILAAETEFTLGRFKCKASGEVPNLDLGTPSLDINPSLALALGYENGPKIYAVVGSVEAEFGYRPEFKAAFEGEVGCERVLRTFTVPLNGFLSWFFGIQVPLGIGMDLDGKIEIAEVGFDISASATATVELGMTCPATGGECTGLNTFEATRDGSFKFFSPDPEDQFRLELGAYGFLFARPSLGSRFSSATQFEFIDAHAGLKQSASFAMAHGQAADTAYASDYHLSALGEIGPGSDLQDAIKKIGDILGVELSIDLTLLELEDTLAESPKGTFTITPASVAPGDTTQLGEMATFTVELNPVTYVDVYSVEKVELFWKKAVEGGAEGEFTLEPGRPGCTDISANSGQTKFECETDFREEDIGKQTFYAFVWPKLFGVALPTPLEVALDGSAAVSVGAGCTLPESGFTGLLQDTTMYVYGDGSQSTSTVEASYGNLSATVNATPGPSDDLQGRRVQVIFDDSIYIVPVDQSRLGTFARLEVTLSGTVEANYPGGGDGASASADLGQYNWAVGVCGLCGEETSKSIMIGETIGFGVPLGSWFRLDGKVDVSASGRYGLAADAHATLRIDSMQLIDQYTGTPMAVESVCSASGTVYPIS